MSQSFAPPLLVSFALKLARRALYGVGKVGAIEVRDTDADHRITEGLQISIDQNDVRHHPYLVCVGEGVLGGTFSVESDEGAARCDVHFADQWPMVGVQRKGRKMVTTHLEAERAAGQAEKEQQRALLLADLRREHAQVVDSRQWLVTLLRRLSTGDVCCRRREDERERGEKPSPLLRY